MAIRVVVLKRTDTQAPFIKKCDLSIFVLDAAAFNRWDAVSQTVGTSNHYEELSIVKLPDVNSPRGDHLISKILCKLTRFVFCCLHTLF